MFRIISLMIISFGFLIASNFGKITTGSPTGTYIEIGKDISRVMNEYNIRLNVVDSYGSSNNLDLLTNKNSNNSNIYWGIIQKDSLDYYKYKNPNRKIEEKVKTIFPIYNEAVHILIKKDSSLDLKENRNFKVAVNSKQGGSYITAQYIESAYGIKFDYIFIKNFTKAKKLLEIDEIDMYIEVIALGNEKFNNLKNFDLLELKENMQIDDTYKKEVVNNKTYSWLGKEKNIYTIPSIIVTNVIEEENDKSIEAFIKILLANYKNLKTTGHDKWKEVDFRNLKNIDGTYHPKAIEVYKSLNIIN